MVNSDKNHSPEQKTDLPVISKPAQRALAEAGYLKLEQFTRLSEADVLKLHGVGPKGIRILREALAERGWTFAEKKSSLLFRICLQQKSWRRYIDDSFFIDKRDLSAVNISHVCV